MWRFHLESQKSPNEVKMASGCEWEWVAKCNDKLHTECFFRLFKEKGLQVTDLQCLRRNTDLPERRGGDGSTLIISLVSIREQDAQSRGRRPGLALQPRVSGQRAVSVCPGQPGPAAGSVPVSVCECEPSACGGWKPNHPMSSQVSTYTGHTKTGLAADSGLLLQPVFSSFLFFLFFFPPLLFSFSSFSFLFSCYGFLVVCKVRISGRLPCAFAPDECLMLWKAFPYHQN